MRFNTVLLSIGFLLFLISSPVYPAVCATADANSALILSHVPIGDCAGYVILDSSDWLGSSVWAIPSLSDIALVWSTSFILPTSLYLIAWSIGRVVNFFK